jgi:fluoride exporter
MNNVLLVALGGGLGAALRHGVNLVALRLLGPNFPWGTFTINIAGSLAMGIFIELLARRFSGSEGLRLFVATGILGGFTTFSSFSLDFAVLWQRGAVGAALGYVAGSVALSLAAVFVGFWLAKTVAG